MRTEPYEGSVGDLLAANLKAARARRGVSLSEAARLSGISKATLSQLESGTGNPTVETVFSLSRALGEPISALLEPHPHQGMTVIRAAEVAPLVGDGVDLRPYGRIESAGLLCELYDQQVRAGARQESPGHVGTEHTVVRSGVLRVDVDGVRVELGPGDYVSFDASAPHAYSAPAGPVRSVLFVNHRADAKAPADAPH
ncbi:XRE family transcriptional regulator [Streptomyces tremellae]|uniref:XRE family transcriptional regulator n=1 Tax=Streptomyces tremellae TaxID=1124239 RepID=A0ABP7G3Y3_9ACTN